MEVELDEPFGQTFYYFFYQNLTVTNILIRKSTITQINEMYETLDL